MKVIAFYLPQFHTIPENDKWWGKGFTEWTNTKTGKPLFRGHYQPHTPLGENYYDLLEKNVLKNQIQLAKDYGVDGFCYYHYWFKGGKKLLEKPVENMLQDSSIDMPFCLCWANENWSRRWDGSEKEVLMEQEYGDLENWTKHYEYLSTFFHDKRYIRVDNCPLLLIYKPEEIPDLQERLDYWSSLARKDGFEKIVFAVQYPEFNYGILRCFDYVVEFEPAYTSEQNREQRLRSFVRNPLLFINVAMGKVFQSLRIRPYKKFSYKLVSNSSANRQLLPKHFPGAFPNWDNTARKKNKSDIYHGSTPELFEQYLDKQFAKKYRDGTAPEFLFINAWNEWAEGAHLEPDEKYGNAYLEKLKKVKQKYE